MNDDAQERAELSKTLAHDGFSETADGASTKASHSASGADFTLPESIGNYEIVDKIAHGGMGIVFRARQKNLGRIVALKMILSDRDASEKELLRFQAEAEAAAGLVHPNIVPVFEFGEFEGRCYFSMGYVEGESLADRVAKSPLEPRQAAALIKTVADAIHFAHERDIIHRDIKPANILLDHDDRPHVTDFGLAKRVSHDGNLTLAGQLIGTPFYMPPEQAASDAENVTRRSDVYSLGATLYCLLTGRPPFQSANLAETLRQVIESEPVRPRHLNAAIPQDLETICLKCMEKQPAKRYASARELSEELQRFLNDEPIQARPLGRVSRAWRWCRRNPIAAGLVSTGVLLLLSLSIGGTVVAVQQSRLAQKTTENAQQQKQITEQREQSAADKEAFLIEQQKLTEAAQVEARKSLHSSYASAVALAFEAWKAGDDERARNLLDRLRPAQQSDTDLRSFDWYFVSRLVNSATPDDPGGTSNYATHLKAPGGQAEAAAFSAAGNLLATAGAGNTVCVWDVSAQPPVVVHEWPGIPFLADPPAPGGQNITPVLRAIAFSRDGRLLAATSGTSLMPGPVVIWNLETGEEQLRLAGLQRPVHDLVFHPDGTQLITVDGNAPYHGQVRFWDVEDGQVVKTFSPNINEIHSVDCSPDGRTLAIGGGYGDDRGDARLIDIDSGDLVHDLVGPSKHVNTIRFSADGERLVTVEGFWFGTGAIRVWNVATGEQEIAPAGHSGSVLAAAFTSDGNRLATAGRDRQIHIWDTVSGDHLMQLDGHGADIYAVGFSADDSYLVSVAHAPAETSETLIWDGSLPSEPIIFRGHEDKVIAVDFLEFKERSPAILISLSEDQTVRIWDVDQDGLETSRLDANFKLPLSMTTSQDGEYIITTRVGDQPFTTQATVWDARTQQPLSSADLPFVAIPMDITPDHRLLAFGGNELVSSTIHLYGFPELQPQRQIDVSQALIGAMAFSPDGSLLATASSQLNGGEGSVVQINRTGDGSLVRELKLDDTFAGAVAFSADGMQLAIAASPLWDLSDAGQSLSSSRIYDVNSGDSIRELGQPNRGGLRVEFTPFGLVELGGDNVCRMWNVATGECAWEYSLGDTSDATAIPVSRVSRDGRWMALSRPDHTLVVLNLESGQPLSRAARSHLSE